MTLKDVENLISDKIQCSDDRWMEHLKHLEYQSSGEDFSDNDKSEAIVFDGYIAKLFIHDILSHLNLTDEQKEYTRKHHYPSGEAPIGFSIYSTLCWTLEETDRCKGNLEELQRLKKIMEYNARIGIIEQVAQILETAHQKPLSEIH